MKGRVNKVDAFDQTVSEKLQQELQVVQLSSSQKEELGASMIGELQANHLSAGQRLLRKIKIFWQSTYEVSLAPTAATICILLVVAGVKWLHPTTTKPVEPTYFIRQTDAGLEITPLENTREVE
ncbi:MAG TPA: hypothetical protein VFC74_02270 [Oscillospiraceae bacterium]|nr:hypothetical protein [Oscillospiraceae bacterium]